MEAFPDDVDETARTNLSCSADDEATGEAQESLSGLTFVCISFVSVAAEIGCNKGLLDRYCPSATQKTIVDTLDKTKKVTISCDTLRYVVCGAGTAAAGELMRRYCLIT